MQKQLDTDRIAKAVLEALAAPIDALGKRIEALEARPAPVNGKDGVGISDQVTDSDGLLVLTLTDGRAVKTGVRSGKDGKDADPETIAKTVKAEVEAQLPEAVSKIETVKGDPGPAPDMDAIKGMIDEAISVLPKPEDGKDGDPGKDADEDAIFERVKVMVLPEIERAVSEIEPIKGEPGEPAPPPDMKAIEQIIADKVAAIPVPKNGDPGAPGKDGFGFEDLEEEIADEGRIVIRRYKRGAETKEFRHKLPVVLDRGVFKEGQSYERGDGVTWAGSFWIAQAPTDTKPGQSDAWRLAVKRGRDGKDGKDGEKGDPGKDAK